MREPGREWSVVKLRPDGSRAAQYRATETAAPEGWIAVRAAWVYGVVDIGHFTFEPGDVLHEYFALDDWYNAFATFREGRLVGWYCNVTYPTIVSDAEIAWHDLYVDVIVMPDGGVFVVDEDELEDAGLLHSDPSLYQRILAVRDELLTLIDMHAYPFSEIARTIPTTER